MKNIKTVMNLINCLVRRNTLAINIKEIEKNNNVVIEETTLEQAIIKLKREFLKAGKTIRDLEEYLKTAGISMVANNGYVVFYNKEEFEE